MQVFAGAKPFLEKAINSLTEALMDSLVAVFTDNKANAFHRFDINGYVQLMLEVCYSLPCKLTPPKVPLFVCSIYAQHFFFCFYVLLFC